jgi:hypothetical protein
VFTKIEFKITRMLLMMVRDNEIDVDIYRKLSRLVNVEMGSYIIDETNGYVFKKQKKKRIKWWWV